MNWLYDTRQRESGSEEAWGRLLVPWGGEEGEPEVGGAAPTSGRSTVLKDVTNGLREGPAPPCRSRGRL